MQLATAKRRRTLFNLQAFLAKKPADSYRIFCLGGSTTYGRPYDDQASFAGFLRAALPKMDAGKDWEVINAGGISYGSARIALLMRELIRYEPDLFIIYTGHNEFLEDRTYESLIKTPETIRDLGGWAAHSRTYSLAYRLLRKTESGNQGEQPDDEDDVRTLLDRSVGPEAYHRDDQWRLDVTSRFRDNLEEVVGLAKGVGAKVILVTPASSLRDCKPFKSELPSHLAGSELQLFRRHLNAARQSLDENDTESALHEVTLAMQIDDRHADLHYLRGQILLSVGNEAEARDAFLRAREEDICPLRARTDILKAVKDIADKHGLPLVDFATHIDELADQRIPGSDWFIDHVHPTIAGHRLLAQKLCDAFAAHQIANAQPEWGPEQFSRIADSVESQIDPSKHAMALRNLAKVLGWAGKLEESDRLAQKAVEQLPNDSESQTMAGYALLRNNRIDEAQKHFAAALQIDPKNARALVGLGDVLSRGGQYEAARQCFESAARIDADLVPAWFNLGNTLRDQGRYSQAASAYRRALRIEPTHADAHKNLGLVLITQGNVDGGVRELKLALEHDPNSSQRHAELGLVLIDAGDLAQATERFQVALEIDPKSIPARIGMALVHERQGNPTDAAETLRKALEINPDHPGARQLLERMTQQR